MRTGPRSPGSWEPSGARPRPQPHPTRPPLPTPLTPAAPRLEQGGGSRTAWGRPSAHLSRAPAPRPPGAVMPVSQAEELRQSPDSNPRSLVCAPNLWPRGNGLGGGWRSDKGLRAEWASSAASGHRAVFPGLRALCGQAVSTRAGLGSAFRRHVFMFTFVAPVALERAVRAAE